MTGAGRAIDARKMHGAENTFVLLDERPPQFALYGDLARALCATDGPMQGADGILIVCEPGAPGGALARMRIFNADGSEAEMCGNGVRCVARYLAERGAGDAFTLATLAGPIAVEVVRREPFEARVDVGRVRFPHAAREETFEALGATWRFYDVSLGNPHAVIFVPDVGTVDLVALGTSVQRLDRFPAGTNVHVASVEDRSTLRVRHFERGVGLTRACGTGAVACAAAAITVRDVTSPVTVHVPGGTLEVVWRAGGTALLTGGAEDLARRTLIV